MAAEWAKAIVLGNKIGKGIWNNPLVAVGRNKLKKAILGDKSKKTSSAPKAKNKPINKAPSASKNNIVKPAQNPVSGAKPKKQSLRFDTTTTLPELKPSKPTTYSPIQRQNRKKLMDMGFSPNPNKGK